jgi:hypothetical protein
MISVCGVCQIILSRERFFLPFSFTISSLPCLSPFMARGETFTAFSLRRDENEFADDE